MNQKRKYPPGFMPVHFGMAGKALLVVGIGMVMVTGLDRLAGWSYVTNGALFVGLGMVAVGWYMVFVVRSE